MFAKVDVNGKDAHPLFTWLKGEKKGLFGGKIKWNFTKFLVGRDGEVIERYAPTTEPKDIADDIRAALAVRRGCMSPWLVLVPIGVLCRVLVLRLAAPRRRARVASALGPVCRGVVLLVLTAFALAGFDVWGGWLTPAQVRPAVWVGQAFLATCLYLFLGLVPVWLVCVGIWLVGRGPDRGRDARRRVNRVASPLVAAVAVGVTAYGAVEAATPAVTRLEVASPQLPAGVRRDAGRSHHRPARRGRAQRGVTRQVVDLTNAAHPDLVVIAGDLEDGTAARYAPEIAPLADLEAPLGVFVTTGNHEMYRDTANWVTAFEEVGLTVLAERGGAAGARRRHDHGGRDCTTWSVGRVGSRRRRRAGWRGCRRRSPCSWPTSRSPRSTSRGAGSTRSCRATPTVGRCGRPTTSCRCSSRCSRAWPPSRGPRSSRPGGPGVGAADRRGRRPRGADRHPEALVSNPGVVVGDDGLARPVWASVDPLLRDYYDTEWGMPVRDERGMFERLSLEAFQSGLSWATILRKRPSFRGGVRRLRPGGGGGVRRRPTSSG